MTCLRFRNQPLIAMKIVSKFSVTFCISCLIACLPSEAAEPVEWIGLGEYRLLVEVASHDLGRRTSDERPAEVEINLEGELSKLGTHSLADITTLQVMRYDIKTGKPYPNGHFAGGRSEFDRPFRWYDGSIPYEFPEFAARLHPILIYDGLPATAGDIVALIHGDPT